MFFTDPQKVVKLQAGWPCGNGTPLPAAVLGGWREEEWQEYLEPFKREVLKRLSDYATHCRNEAIRADEAARKLNG